MALRQSTNTEVVHDFEIDQMQVVPALRPTSARAESEKEIIVLLDGPSFQLMRCDLPGSLFLVDWRRMGRETPLSRRPEAITDRVLTFTNLE